MSPSEVDSILAETAETDVSYPPKQPGQLRPEATTTSPPEYQFDPQTPAARTKDGDDIFGGSDRIPPPVKAELVTNELDDVGGAPPPTSVRPPPYHIAAAKSKHAVDFSNMLRSQNEDDPYYENQVFIVQDKG